MADSKVWYDVNCHCRLVRLRVHIAPLYAPEGSSLEDEVTKVTDCNCSVCLKNGYLNIYPADREKDVEWVSGKDELKSYGFGSGSVGHMFCPTCGSSIVLDVDTSNWRKDGGGEKKYGINVSRARSFCPS